MKQLFSLVCLLILTIILGSCSDNSTTIVPDTTNLIITDLTVGTGAEAVNGKTVTVHYVGTLTNGQKFDSSRDRGKPFSFHLGANEVIQGWEQGIPKMRVGGLRKLVIPPSLGYGNRVIGTIPANSTLIFEVELLSIQ